MRTVLKEEAESVQVNLFIAYLTYTACMQLVCVCASMCVVLIGCTLNLWLYLFVH